MPPADASVPPTAIGKPTAAEVQQAESVYRDFREGRAGTRAFHRGLVVHTTVRPAEQMAAYRALRRGLDGVREYSSGRRILVSASVSRTRRSKSTR